MIFKHLNIDTITPNAFASQMTSLLNIRHFDILGSTTFSNLSNPYSKLSFVLLFRLFVLYHVEKTDELEIQPSSLAQLSTSLAQLSTSLTRITTWLVQVSMSLNHVMTSFTLSICSYISLNFIKSTLKEANKG